MQQLKKGKWIFKQTWYSICSAHQNYKPGCSLCCIGHWSNDITHWIGGQLFKYLPKLWIWAANRKKIKIDKLN